MSTPANFNFATPIRESARTPNRALVRSNEITGDENDSNHNGNSWLLQETTTRLPGRIDTGVTSYGSATDLASALRRAEAAHGEH